MKFQCKINLIGETQSGISQSTGNEWKKKELVLEFEGDNHYTNTMAVVTFNKDLIAKLEGMTEGAEVEANVAFTSKARNVENRTTGAKYIIRNTECTLLSVEDAMF